MCHITIFFEIFFFQKIFKKIFFEKFFRKILKNFERSDLDPGTINLPEMVFDKADDEL